MYEREVVSVSVRVMMTAASETVVVVVTSGKVLVILTVAVVVRSWVVAVPSNVVRVEVSVTGFTKGGKLQPML